MGGRNIPASVRLIAGLCAKRKDPRSFAYVPGDEEKNGREIAKNWLSNVFLFRLVCLFDQFVFIMMARDLLSFGFSLRSLRSRKGILSHICLCR